MDGNIQTNLDGKDNSCFYRDDCLILYKGCNPNMCHVSKELEQNKIPIFLRKKMNKTLDTVNCVCPRDVNIKIINKCINVNCPFFNPKTVYNCVKIHSSIFNKKIINILSYTLDTDIRYIEYGLKQSVYLIRLYLILLLYILENNQSLIDEIQELKRYKDILTIYLDKLINSGYKELFKQSREQTNFNEYWINIITTKNLKINITDMGYKKFYTHYHKYKNKTKLMRSLIETIRINEYRLLDIPLNFIVNTYYMLFGYIDINNFGLCDKYGKQMTKLFLK